MRKAFDKYINETTNKPTRTNTHNREQRFKCESLYFNID